MGWFGLIRDNGAIRSIKNNAESSTAQIKEAASI